MKGLDKQVYIYSLGTECFYTDSEYEIHKQLLKSYILRGKIKESRDKISKKIVSIDKEIDGGDSKHLLETLVNEKKKLKSKASNLSNRARTNSKRIEYLKNLLKKEFEKTKGIRSLRSETLTDNKVIGIFDSALSRTIGMETNSLSDSLFVVRAFYLNVLEDIIINGFKHNGEEYVYFSSSAGQIRTKKTVFIKKTLWDKHENTLMCGLTIENINNNSYNKKSSDDDTSGCNVNKLLAYKALTSSASMEWKNFDINKAIVVPDLESPITTEFDYINRNTYEITRKELTVNIEHTDGCGMILPSKSKKSFMTRLPFVKGLLVPFDFREFVKTEESISSKVKDIYGKEWDIIEDEIEVIFTKSQFKMWKYYENWQDYKDKFVIHDCKANKLNIESETGNATLNYQMIQTLTDFKNDELKELTKDTVKDIESIGSSKETMLRILGVTTNNRYKNHYQNALSIYPELLNDAHSKKVIKDKKRSMVNDARAGKLRINGKYLYLIPDLYAFCEFLFKGEKNPKGLLKNEEVYTKSFDIGKVDILRSPHLYKEHAIRKNISSKEIEKWFITQGIYTSVHDPISRILQFDNDGDMGLVIQDELFVNIAERNMKGIVPLYYEMETAPAQKITNKEIYDSLIAAFKANIGEVSNNITKIFNSNEDIDLDVVKWLTAENNYIIDYAKTLYMPKRPPEVDDAIKKATKGKVPHFFIEAKQKDKKNVEQLNGSTMNRLRKVIPNKTIKFSEIAGEFDYSLLMSEDIKYVNREIINNFKKLEREKRWKYRKSAIKESKEGTAFFFKYVRDELLKIEPDVNKIANSLVKEFFHNVELVNKDTLWNSFGDVIVRNLRSNLKGTKQCECCGVRIEAIAKNSKYCENCAIEIRVQQNKEKALRYYHKNK